MIMIFHKGIRSLKENAYVCLTLDPTKDVEAIELLKFLPLKGPISGRMRD